VNASNSEYKPAERQECYNTHYKTQLQSFGSSTFTDADGAGKKLLDAVTKNPNIKVKPEVHDSNKQTILDTNKSNRIIQRQLDRKMSEMLSDKSGIKLESATKENSTMYVNILWTVLAATTLYYIFIRL
jgi:hypothetical protein